MSPLLTPMPLQPLGSDAVAFSASDFRQFVQAIFPHEGVCTFTGLAVAQRGLGANMSVDVAAGQAVVKCDTASPAGMYVVTSTGTVNVALPAAPGSGTRTHYIIARVNDNQDDGSGLYSWTPDVAIDSGTGAVMPASALKLADVTVAHGQASVTNSNINDDRTFATGFGVPNPQMSVPNTIAGTFIQGKPVRIDTSYQEFVTPDDGKFHPSCPDGATAILSAAMQPSYHDGTSVNMQHGWSPELHTGGSSTLSSLMFQARNLTNGTVITNTWIGYSLTVVYQ